MSILKIDLVVHFQKNRINLFSVYNSKRNELNSQGTINTDEFECSLVCPGDVEVNILSNFHKKCYIFSNYLQNVLNNLRASSGNKHFFTKKCHLPKL